MNDDAQVFWQLGEDGLAKLVGDFYVRVRADDLIGPMYPDNDWENAERRLRDFLIGRFGGPQRYIEERGHPRLRMRHAPFSIGVAERDRWLELMGAAMDATEVPAPSRAILEPFFAQVADFMRNRVEG